MKAKYYIIISLVLIGCKKDPIDNDIVDKIDNFLYKVGEIYIFCYLTINW